MQKQRQTPRWDGERQAQSIPTIPKCCPSAWEGTGCSPAGDGENLAFPQECLSHQQVLSTVRQMQKLLSAQEAAHLQGTRSLKKQLSALQSRVQRLASKPWVPSPSSPLAVPANGRKLGRSARVGHDVHFVCDAGFRLVGSETRTCRRDRTWGGTQPSCRSIDDCSSNPCANGGTCVDGNQSYTCLCPRGWSGTSCQSPVYTYVDECQLFQPSPQTRLCLHDCLNLPGSYRCLCPPGYVLHADRNTCEDVDECTGSQHNCTHGELCINTFGGHRCVRPKCPPPRHNTSYVKTSSFQCERNPCPMDSRACRLAATSISFHYLPLQANRSVPRVLFKMSTTRFVGDSLRFAIMGGRGQGVFAVRRSDRQTGELVLTSPVVGPATLEVELEMSEFSRKVLLGKHIFKVTAFVSPYEF
uniref:Fibulin 7 n=1 Tax=Anas zonorhyncha TaxID=75864 RepID=A0A8B9ZVE1_9AVES